MILSAWVDDLHVHVAESFTLKEVQFKQFCLPVKTGCSPADSISETPADTCTPVADRPLSLKSDHTRTFHSIMHPLIKQEQQLTGKFSISGLTGWKHKDTHGGMSEPS